jgi:hypothetical protein
MTKFQAVQLYDDQSADRTSARYICFADDPPLNAGQFTIISCPSGRVFLGVVAGANLNFNRNALGPTDNTAINQAEEIAFGRMNREIAVREVFYYEILLLKEIAGNAVSSVRVRPKILSSARPATDEEIIRYLGMPDISLETQVGQIIDTEVPVCVSKLTLTGHVLVGGCTGAGKTNSIGNIARAAVEQGMFVAMFDHKPDYQNAHEPNDDGAQDYYGSLAADLEYWFIGQPLSMPNRKEHPILVPARDFDLYMLAAAVFHRDGEELQRDAFCVIAETHALNNSHWTISSLRKYLEQLNAKSAPGQPNDQTFRAIKSKINHPNRIPSWIDGREQSHTSVFFGLGETEQTFDTARLVRPAAACIIRVGSGAGDGREYGLLLSYILDEIYQLSEQRRLPCPVLVCVDEAQDIFSAGRSLRGPACEMLDRHVRKGRSRRIGYLFGVQSSESVPDAIMNNLNSRFIHRHNSPDELRIAASMATEEQRKMTATFGPGECLVFLTGANSIIHAQMRRSPFKLTKEEL